MSRCVQLSCLEVQVVPGESQERGESICQACRCVSAWMRRTQQLWMEVTKQSWVLGGGRRDRVRLHKREHQGCTRPC